MDDKFTNLTPLELTKLQKLLAEHEQRLQWSKEQILAEQQLKLRQLLAHAIAHSPWHKERLSHINPQQFTLDSLHNIPVMTKMDAINNWNSIVTDPRLNSGIAQNCLNNNKIFLDQYRFWVTGGTSGNQGIVVWNSEEYLTFISAIYRNIVQHIRSTHQQSKSLAMATLVSDQNPYMSQALWNIPILQNVKVHRLHIQDDVETLAEKLTQIQPTDLVGYTSIISILAAQMRKTKKTICPQRIVTTAEALTQIDINNIKSTWPTAVLSNFYGTTEAGPFSMQCAFGVNSHLFEDLVLIEPMDEMGNPVPTGQLCSKIFVTGLINKTFPIIRYEIDDKLKLSSEPCSCGSAYTVVETAEGGKFIDFIYSNGVKISTTLLYILMYKIMGKEAAHIVNYQMFQTEHGIDIHLKTNGEIQTETIKEDLATELERQGFMNPQVNVKIVNELYRHPQSRKFKQFIPLKK